MSLFPSAFRWKLFELLPFSNRRATSLLEQGKKLIPKVDANCRLNVAGQWKRSNLDFEAKTRMRRGSKGHPLVTVQRLTTI